MPEAIARHNVTIYTDGACSGNPGPGGYGIILIGEQGHRKELSQGYKRTTNNRMELLGVIAALESLKVPCNVKIYTDSQYIVKAIQEGWLNNWVKKNWRKADKQPVMNKDLWQRMLVLLEKNTVTFHWTKGHAGDPLNERCDELAVNAIRESDLLEDEGYNG